MSRMAQLIATGRIEPEKLITIKPVIYNDAKLKF